jgi:hypothetical protein
MNLELETRRRSLLPLLAVGLAGLYLFVFLPLGRKADSLDEPLNQAWRRLATAVGQTNATQLDFVALTNQLHETRAALVVFDRARQQARARIELDEGLRARLAEPFQLVDYNYESGRKMDELSRLARAQSVALEPGVFAGFPDQRADMNEPALLWADLQFLDCLLTTAINAKVATIHSVKAALPSGPASYNGAGTFTELPVHIELTGTAANVGRFLQTLPLRAAEIRAAGLPESPTNKPALFIDRILLRKQAPEKPDEVRLALRAVGFVLRD